MSIESAKHWVKGFASTRPNWFDGAMADAKKSIDSHFPRLADADLH
jgi:hypothetical protein